MNKRSIEILNKLIVFAQKVLTDLMIAEYEGIRFTDINVITSEEQNKLDESVEILKEASNQILNMIIKRKTCK